MHTTIEQAAQLAVRSARMAGPETFGLSTTCSEFDVRALAAHMLNFARLTAHTARKTLPEGEPLDVGDHWHDAYAEWVDEALAAWGEPDALEGETTFGGDPMPAERAAALTVMEFAVHAWDMARTFEERIDPSPELAATVLAAVEQLAEPGRQAGVFGPQVPIEPGFDAFDRALAASGRNPRR